MRFTLYAITVLATYGAVQWSGIDLLPSSTRFQLPASVRSSPGGYRTFHTYYGFHGGK
jgi:hypothetical protein